MIAVTGAAGFIGRQIIQAANAIGIEEIVAVDVLEPLAFARRLRGLTVARTFGGGEFLRALPELSPHLEAVFHEGAETNTLSSDWSELFKRNLHYSRALFDLCQAQGVRLIYASSAAVYGRGERGFAESPVCEAPLNVYGLSKSLFDLFVRSRISRRSSQVVGLRYFNVYGAGEGHKGAMASMVHRLLHQASEGEMCLFAGSESFARDFVSVEDVARVNLFFLGRPDLSGIFNCGTGRAVTFGELARIVGSSFPEASIHSIPFPRELEGKYQAYTCAELEALRKVGYGERFLPPEEGVFGMRRAMESDEAFPFGSSAQASASDRT